MQKVFDNEFCLIARRKNVLQHWKAIELSTFHPFTIQLNTTKFSMTTTLWKKFVKWMRKMRILMFGWRAKKDEEHSHCLRVVWINFNFFSIAWDSSEGIWHLEAYTCFHRTYTVHCTLIIIMYLFIKIESVTKIHSPNIGNNKE